MEYTQIHKEKNLKDDNMQPVGFGNTRILTDYVHKSPWALSYPSFFYMWTGTSDQCPGRFLDMISPNPSVSKVQLVISCDLSLIPY